MALMVGATGRASSRFLRDLGWLDTIHPEAGLRGGLHAFEQVLGLVRSDRELLPALLAAAVALSAVVDGSSPRHVLEQWFRRSVPDEVWRERYLPLFD